VAQRAVPRQGRGAVETLSPKGTATATMSSREIEGLVTEHLPLVGHIARETASRMPRHLGTDDLVGAGSLALVQAAHSYDPSLGVPFARFANTRIRGAMIDQMRQRDWASRSLRTRARALAAAAEHLTTALGRAPDDAEVAKAAGLSESEVREVRSGTDRATLLTLDPLAGDGEGLGSTLADAAPRPEDALIAAERLGYLRDAIAELPERLRVVVSGYYLQQRPLTEIAEELGVTQSRASQLRSEGLDLLREALEALLGDGTRPGRAAREATMPPGVTPSGRARTAAPPQPADNSAGVRARRREAYVDAVARRSGTSQRANVQAYLDGETLDGALL
jgi:RNA polymerase sigma factor for flagellar operon FliA